MKKILAGLALTGLLLSGCSLEVDNKKSEPDIETSSSTAPAPSDELTDDQVDELFAAFVKREIPLFAASPDADIVELGHTVCESFDNGFSFEEVLAVADAGEEDALASLIGAAIGAYCPEHEDKLA